MLLLLASLSYAVDVDYDNGLEFKSKDKQHEVEIGGRLQPRFVAKDIGGDPESTFQLRRARLKLSGELFDEAMAFELQASWDKSNPGLKDAYVEYRANDAVRIRMGQQKKPHDRSFIASSSVIAFADRDLTHEEFGQDRDLGLMVHNGVGKVKGFEYVVGVFNGPEEDDDAPVKPMPGNVLVRAGYNPDGKAAYSAGNFGDPTWGVGATAQAYFDTNDTGDARLDTVVDFALKPPGGASLLGAVHYGFSGPNMAELQGRELGAYADVDYLVSESVMPAVRYGVQVPTGGEGMEQQIMVGTTLMKDKHKAKWVNDLEFILDDSNAVEITYRSQIELYF